MKEKETGPSSSAVPCIDGKLSTLSSRSISAALRKETSAYCARFALRFHTYKLTFTNPYCYFLAYQRYTPTLSTCEVAKKSPVGEKDTLVATLAQRKASISLPVGISNVRIVESREVAISQRESGENVYQARNQQEGKGQ